MPSMPSEPHQVGVSPPKETIHGNIPWSNVSIDENTTIDPIVNVMTLAKTMFQIFQQGHSEGTVSFKTLDQAIKNISKDINVATKKSQTQKRKESETKPWRTKVVAKVARKEIVKKKDSNYRKFFKF
jgi:hypothetical protein